jgi:predicted metal-dependent HD superfamily phosphohydrolase
MDDPPKQRWASLCFSLGATRGVEETFGRLDDLYRGPGRAYHNWDHIQACLEELDPCELLAGIFAPPPAQLPQDGGRGPKVLELALWFHDAIYDPRRADNEERSADLAVSLGGNMGIDRDSLDACGRLVLATKHFGGEEKAAGRPALEAENLIRDIDLAILGQSRPVFEAYEAAIREEFSFVAEGEYRTKRSSVLRSFLERPAIFLTARHALLYEGRARDNLSRLIASLGT